MPLVRLLVAPDAFKGTFRAPEVAAAVGRGIEAAGLEPPDLCPIADGGEGTMEALVLALGGETRGATARDPLGREIRAGFALLEDGETAVVLRDRESDSWIFICVRRASVPQEAALGRRCPKRRPRRWKIRCASRPR